MSIETFEIKVDGMHCVSCERAIERALKKIPGVKKAQVSFVTSRAQVAGHVGEIDGQQLVKAIQESGYRAHLIEGRDEESVILSEKRTFRRESFAVILSVILTLPLIFQMFVPMLSLGMQALLATIIQFGLGWRFYVGSYYALRNFSGNMDLLIALGTSAAYVYSVVVYWLNLSQPTYFEASSAVITFVLIGHLLEIRTKRRAFGAVKALMQLQPKVARVKRHGEWQEIAIEEIALGDLYQVRPGEKIAIDGEVVEGSSYVDESMLTGESVAIQKEKGAKIFGGTQNGEGSLIAQAVAIGAQTALAAIIRLVQQAQASKAPIQSLADKISALFVPTVVLIALLTLMVGWWFQDDFSQALIHSVAVLVIACPCALGMATPMVIMVATGRGAQQGILIRSAEALQLTEKLTTIAFDKTGTLTLGKPILTDVIPDDDEYRRLASLLENLSEHPLAKAIRGDYPLEIGSVTNFKALPGKGVIGVIENTTYFLGSLSWMEEEGIKRDQKRAEALEMEGKTVVCLSNTSDALAYFAVRDPLRARVKRAIEKLKERGLKVVMLTGDQMQTAQIIADQAAISTFFAQILPQEKAEVIKHLKKKGEWVAMVGDGMNDAPALAAADVGISMGSGVDIALKVSDITLMRNDIDQVNDAISLSKATFQKVRQNLFFAFFYNILGIPLAALGYLNPMIAGAAMALSSICVVVNSLLLNGWNK